MTKPAVLQLMPITPNIQAQVDDAFAPHKLWQAADADAFVAEVAPACARIFTNGIIGAGKALIEALPGLEIIGVYGVGVDAVDLATAKARGVRVTNTPDVLTIGVAELALALLLAVARRVAYNDRYVRAGRWATRRRSGARQQSRRQAARASWASAGSGARSPSAPRPST